MTEEGTFILNGCERVIISQIIRSPGVYFRKEFGLGRKVIYTATLISNKGLWTKIILDQKEDKKALKKNKFEKSFLLVCIQTQKESGDRGATSPRQTHTQRRRRRKKKKSFTR